MSGAAPPLSVVMPVLDAGPYLDVSVASILEQSFADFEFVVLDDGSTDGSIERLRGWARADSRIRLIESGCNSGPVASSNQVVWQARAPVIARMDADDVAMPRRLERQMETLRSAEDTVLVGSLAEIIDDAGRHVREPDYASLLRHTRFAPFAHTSVMFRRSVFDRIGGYRSEAARWEDVDLFLRFALAGRVLVLAEPLVRHRQSSRSTRLQLAEAELDSAMAAMYRHVSGLASGRAGKIVPRSFLPGGSTRLWNGQRPRVLPRLLRRGDLSCDWESAAMLLWAIAAELSPRLVRRLLRLRTRVRNGSARRELARRMIVEWEPPSLEEAHPQRPVCAR